MSNKPSISPGTEYVCGFMFNRIHSMCDVLLILKQRPEYQKGKLNGIGGRVESSSETINQAMMREFDQETGLLFPDWIYFCQMRYINKATIHFFYAQGDIEAAAQQTDEPLVRLPVNALLGNDHIVPDVRWLVPMALRMNEEPCKYLEVIKVGNVGAK